MRNIILLAACLICAGRMLAMEQGTISGTVRDARTSEPVVNATVVVLGTQRHDITNFAGEFSIPDVPAGRHRLKASLIGYVAKELDVVAAPNSVTAVEMPLDEDEAIRLEEIVVNANRIHVYPQTDLLTSDVERRWPTDVGGFLRTVPGISSIRRGGTAMDPVIRGFRQEQVNVQIDGGMRVCGACPSRMDPPTAHIQAEDLEKIEILKGPFTVRFGPTLGALVNLVMERPDRFEEPGVLARLEGGYESSWGGKRGRATVSAGSQLFDAYVSGGTKNFGAYRAGDGSDVKAGYRMSDYSVKVGFNPGDQERLQFTNRGSYMRDVYFPSLMMDELFDDTHMYALDYVRKWTGGPISSLSAKGYATFVNHSMGNQWKPTYATMHAVADVTTRTLGGKVEAVLAPLPAMLLYAGVDACEQMKSGDRTRAFLTGPNAGKTLRDTIWQDTYLRGLGAFLESRTFLSDPLTVIAGIRLDHVGVRTDRANAYYRKNFAGLLETRENNLSGVASFLYTLSPSVNIRFGVGHATRSADITERFAYFVSAGRDRYDYIGNPALAPEHNTQLELATDMRVGGVTLQVSVYRSYLSDYISARVDTSVKKVSMDAFGVKRFVNVADADMMGFEATVAAPIISSVRASVNASYSYGQNLVIGEPLPEMPPLNATVLLQYQPVESSSWVELEGRFVARQSRISASFLERNTPGFAVFSLRGGTQLFDHLVLTAGVTNIFDRAFYEHLNRMSTMEGRPILEPGRAFAVNLQFVY